MVEGQSADVKTLCSLRTHACACLKWLTRYRTNDVMFQYNDVIKNIGLRLAKSGPVKTVQPDRRRRPSILQSKFKKRNIVVLTFYSIMLFKKVVY